MTDHVVEWLESPEGEAWSRRHHSWVIGLITIKNNMPVPEPYREMAFCVEHTDYLW
jgi:hypothetical protein